MRMDDTKNAKPFYPQFKIEKNSHSPLFLHIYLLNLSCT